KTPVARAGIQSSIAILTKQLRVYAAHEALSSRGHASQVRKCSPMSHVYSKLPCSKVRTLAFPESSFLLRKRTRCPDHHATFPRPGDRKSPVSWNRERLVTPMATCVRSAP